MTPAIPTPLLNTRIVIIGGTSGIGLATAAAAKAAGANVTLVGRTAARLKAAAGQLGGVETAVADITDRKSVEAVFAGMTAVDHIVVTAGRLAGGRLAETDPDQLAATLHERITGPLYVIKAALGLMPPTGSIVLTGGQFSDRPPGNGDSVVSAAVRGIEALARSLALELKPIRVNVISPGYLDTPLFDVLGKEARTALLSDVAAALPGGRLGEPAEIAEAILLLLGNRYINAEVLHVDGAGRFV